MNRKRASVKICFLSLLSLVQSLPFPSNFDLQLPKHLESEICVYNDVIYPAGQNFTATNPCETCICDPPKYTCTVKNCLLRVGCKSLHKANECCPEYICDCEKNGKRYANGEKVDEANPCKVCYCTGGEIKCNLVECYSRSDCDPIYVPGKCCPKYDHCPPLEQMKNNKPTVKATDEPEAVEIIRDDVTNGSQHSSASVKTATVATLEVIEIHPTNPCVSEKKKNTETEVEINATMTVLDMTSTSLEYEYENGTEETENVSDTIADVENTTPVVLLKEADEFSSAEPETRK